MRSIAAIFGAMALAFVVSSSPPAAALGIHVGPFYLHIPLVGHHYRHRPHMTAKPTEARTGPNDVSRGGGYNSAVSGRYARTEQSDHEALVETNTAALESCTGLAPGVTNLPIDQIRQTVHPTADQEAALDDLSAASSQASDVIKSSCPSSVPLTPIGRLDAAEQRLNATIKAIQLVRSPLERFYRALNDEQRQRFNATNSSNEGSCTGSFLDVPVQRIERVVQPTAQQQSAFEDLKKVTRKASAAIIMSDRAAEIASSAARYG